ncbi:MAG: hypothetical protein GWN01_03745, partial [Nitrosopumilaceae archaeon]|nr:hypothetical protein [Nitrosopumilaceae archaeon]NIV65158.1 hypothetical protein [Nitrosopumilaceae archaeon]NIX60672.1 hypothetical protein [Nitrosopumilaceae archaeon]
MAVGDDAAKKMAELDSSAGMVDPTQKRLVSEDVTDVLSDEALANQMLE